VVAMVVGAGAGSYSSSSKDEQDNCQH